MKAPVRQLRWAGVFLLAGFATAGAQDVCGLSDVAMCKSFAPELKLGCTKHVQLAVASCRKARRIERFGSHEDHCKAACRAGVQAYKLDRGLQDYAITTAESSALGNQDWLAKALRHWQAMGTPDAVCSKAAFAKAKVDCETHCSVKARRRDLEELQALAAGGEFLELRQPVFACPPGPAMRAFSGSQNAVIKHLYAPGARSILNE